MTPRALTHDEKKAAEAAFNGLPFNPDWSESARKVYDGIAAALSARSRTAGETPLSSRTEPHGPESCNAEVMTRSAAPPVGQDSPASSPEMAPESQGERSNNVEGQAPTLLTLNRAEAIQAGLLVDVTPVAQEVGLYLPVGMSRPLWEIGITASHQLADDQYKRRVRDVLLALRLHLETRELTFPWIEFPALLSFPPDETPQVFALYALAHKAPGVPYSLTLLLPHELPRIRLFPSN